MNRLSTIVAIALAISLPDCLALEARPTESTLVAFDDVNIVSMRNDEMLSHQTVLVEGDRIVAIGPTDRIQVPTGASRISGLRRYLVPGLVDMHAHFLRNPTGSATEPEFARLPGYQQRNEDFAVLFVANGITSVRQLHGHAAGDELAKRTSDRKWIGPKIYSTGPITDGDPPEHPMARVVVTRDDALRAVAEDHAAGRVGIKVYSSLSAAAYDHIVVAAAKAKLDVVGHVPDRVTVEHAIDSRQATIEHVIDSFLPSLLPAKEAARETDSEAMYRSEASYRQADLTRLAGYARALRRAGIWTCPAIVTVQFDRADYVHADEFRYIEPAFASALHGHWSRRPFDEELKFALSAVRVLHENDAGLLLGSDSYVVVPGFSALQELEYFVEAGLTPYEALRTGTVNAAQALHQDAEFGTVDIGKRADLLLLEANPLSDIRNIRKRAGVMLRGRWLPENELRGRLVAIEQRINRTAQRR